MYVIEVSLESALLLLLLFSKNSQQKETPQNPLYVFSLRLSAARAKGYKLDKEFFDRADHSCSKCTNFKDTFSYFKQLDNKDLKVNVRLCARAHGRAGG